MSNIRKTKVKASVVIPAYNAQKTIKDLLNSLQKQDCPCQDYEVIIIDDGSTDQTAEIVRKYPFRYFYQRNQGAGAARNYGAQKARGGILLFIDSDCVAPQSWLKRHLAAHHKDLQFGIIGGGVKKPRGKNWLAWADFFSSWWNAHEDLKKHEVNEYLPSLNWSVKKDVFKEVGGFWQKKTTGEDVDFCYRVRKKGYKIFFDSALAVWHQSPSFKGLLKHNFNWGCHAPFVRGKEFGLKFHWFFKGGFLKACLMFWPLVLGYTLLIIFSWRRYQSLRVLVCLPLIFLSKLAYGCGLLKGTWEKSSKEK